VGRLSLRGHSGQAPAGLHATMTIQSFRPHVGGAELQLERLAPHLAARGVESEILTRAVAGSPREEAISGSTVRRTRLAGESPLASISYVASSLAHLVRRRARIDLVHAHGALSPATIALGGRLLRLPCLVTVLGTGPQGDLERLAGKPLGRTRARLLSRTASFVALSAEARRELLDFGVPDQRIFNVPNGVDLGAFRPADSQTRRQLRQQLGLPLDRFVAGFAGRLHPVKDVDTLLEATARVPDLTLVVVGDGPERARLETKTHELGLQERVTFLGQSSRVHNVLRACDAFVLSSHGEGMSNALLEAMACGLPCLASESVGGAGELLGGGRGLLVANADAGAWASALTRVAGDAGMRAAMGDAASSFVAGALSLDAVAERLVYVYGVIVGATSRTA
jgi:glycosyltransferase involved in cell wall biosynthesis